MKKFDSFRNQHCLNHAGTVGLTRVVAMVVTLCVFKASGQATHQFDFGVAATEPGYVAVGSATAYSAGSGYGWLSTIDLQDRDRSVAGDLRRDFVIRIGSTSGNTFRVSSLTPNGKYLVHVLCGDALYGDHVIDVSVPFAGTLPTISPRTAQYLQLSATVDADASGILDITFSPGNNWVVNALTLEPTMNAITPTIESAPYNEWDPAVFATDPTTNLLAGFDGTGAVGFSRPD